MEIFVVLFILLLSVMLFRFLIKLVNSFGRNKELIEEMREVVNTGLTKNIASFAQEYPLADEKTIKLGSEIRALLMFFETLKETEINAAGFNKKYSEILGEFSDESLEILKKSGEDTSTLLTSLIDLISESHEEKRDVLKKKHGENLGIHDLINFFKIEKQEKEKERIKKEYLS